MKAIVAKRGQITIPKVLRQRLGIKPGTILNIEIQKTMLVAQKIKEQDPVDQVYGCLKEKLHTNKVIDELRDKE